MDTNQLAKDGSPAPASASPVEPTREAVAEFEARRAQARRMVEAVVPALPQEFFEGVLNRAQETPETRAEREAAEKKRAEHRRRSELMNRFVDLVSQAGERYRFCKIENFECTNPQQTKVVAALREYLDGDSSDSVVLYGPVGTGKDHLAFAICREAIRAGKTVGWINGQKWFGMVRDAMDTNRTEDSLIADLRRPDVLCLSDPLPPVGPLTQHQSTMLYRLVDARYSRGVPTICTINVSGDDEADERLGAATWDRLCHGAWRLNCKWPTYRKPTRDV